MDPDQNETDPHSTTLQLLNGSVKNCYCFLLVGEPWAVHHLLGRVQEDHKGEIKQEKKVGISNTRDSKNKKKMWVYQILELVKTRRKGGYIKY